MIVYLKDKETQKVIQQYTNIISWANNYVEFNNGNNRCKLYCNENEYFTREVTDGEDNSI